MVADGQISGQGLGLGLRVRSTFLAHMQEKTDLNAAVSRLCTKKNVCKIHVGTEQSYCSLHMNSAVLGVCFVLTSDPGPVSDIILHQQNVKVGR